jgi:LysM repeat protein
MVTLSVPVFLVLFVIFLGVGGGLTYAALNLTGEIVEPTEGPTPTLSPTITQTTTPEPPTPTNPPAPTPTPGSYEVRSGDTCGAIAFAFDVSITSIILENGLAADCGLSVGMVLKIPHPTPTLTPEATNTPSSRQATVEACEKVYHVVQDGETLSLIALQFEVPMEHIMEWSGKTVVTAFYGETLTIPLCLRNTVAGATVTPSPAPPYPAPELLLPRNGEAFSLENDTVTLQWASVGTLRENEFYLVTVIDVTAGLNEELTEPVKDTKFIVPGSYRPADNQPHIYKWSVVPVARVSVDEDGNPQYRDGGARSEENFFSWVGGPAQTTPEP